MSQVAYHWTHPPPRTLKFEARIQLCRDPGTPLALSLEEREGSMLGHLEAIKSRLGAAGKERRTTRRGGTPGSVGWACNPKASGSQPGPATSSHTYPTKWEPLGHFPSEFCDFLCHQAGSREQQNSLRITECVTSSGKLRSSDFSMSTSGVTEAVILCK